MAIAKKGIKYNFSFMCIFLFYLMLYDYLDCNNKYF